MRKKTLVATLILACAMAASAKGDTLYLSNGTAVSGTVAKNADGIYVLTVNGRQMMYRAAEVAKLEKNSATGLEYKEQAGEIAKAREKERTQATGLFEEDRVQVEKLIQSLRTAEAKSRSQIVADLIELGQKVDLVRYLEMTLPSLAPATYPYVLEVYCALAPRAKAQAMLTASATHLSIPIRRQALRLMGSVGDDQCVDILGRGLVDPSPEVELAAIAALGELKAKRATPALIESMNRSLPVIQNAVQHSLAQIWESNSDLPADSDLAAWEQFWSERKSGVGSPIDARGLRPLVDPDIHFVEG